MESKSGFENGGKIGRKVTVFKCVPFLCFSCYKSGWGGWENLCNPAKMVYVVVMLELKRLQEQTCSPQLFLYLL